jgi:nitrogen fixation protein NifX
VDAASVETMDAKIAALDGCGVLFTCQLSDFAASRIYGGRTFPVKMEYQRDINTVLTQIQFLINTSPPRWLRKRLVSGEVT